MKPTTRTLALILCGLILAIMLIPVVMGGMMGSGPLPGMMGPGMMGPGMSGAGHLRGWTWGLMLALGSLRAIAVAAALIVGVLLLVRTQRSDRPGETAAELLQRRYAAGELSTAEYDHMRQEIRPSSPE